MNRISNKSEPYSSSELSKFEKRLQSVLRPIIPNHNYVENLRARLQGAPQVRKNKSNFLRYSVLGFAGVLSSAILIVTGVRAALTFIGAIGIIYHAKGHLRNNSSVPV